MLLLAAMLVLESLERRASAGDALRVEWDEAGEVDVVCLRFDWCEDEGPWVLNPREEGVREMALPEGERMFAGVVNFDI